MTLRTSVLRVWSFSVLSLVLGVVFVAATTTAGALNLQDNRAADREAIRAHIDSIFQAFIKKDAAALRATHAENWLGYLEGSREMIKGVNGYMDWNQVDPKSPYWNEEDERAEYAGYVRANKLVAILRRQAQRYSF